MADEHNSTPADVESQVWNAIAAFEQILEAMPDDRSSLETLAHAYTHIGDRTRAVQYLVRLGRVILDEQDAEAAGDLCRQLAEYEGTGEVAELQTRLKALADGQPLAAAPLPEPREDAGATPRVDRSKLIFRVTDELALAYTLLEAGELAQADYAAIAQDLSEMSTGRSAMTISVLHVLEHRAFKHLERVMAYIATRGRAPVVLLHCFEPPRETLALLPLEFIIRRGAIVFELIKEDALVAVMNPMDQRLRADVTELTGRTCHFFTTLASEFDSLAAKLHSGFGSD